MRRHRIVDGNTIEGLALAYLGTADRWREIYELNKDRLPHGPDVVPVGTELRLPPRRQPESSTQGRR